MGLGKGSSTGTPPLKDAPHLLASLSWSGAEKKTEVLRSVVGYLFGKFHGGRPVPTLQCGSLCIETIISGPG